MPFYQQAPRPGKTPYIYIRGKHGVINIDQIKSGGFSTRSTDQAEVADLIKLWQNAAITSRAAFFAELGVRDPELPVEQKIAAITLTDALIKKYGPRERLSKRDAYIIEPLLDVCGGKLDARKIDQAVVDTIADKLYPGCKPGTVNRQVHSPIKAALRKSGIAVVVNRPEGHSAYEHDSHLTEDEIPLVLAAADRVDHEYGLFVSILATSPTRLGEVQALRTWWVDLRRKVITVPGEFCKNGKAHTFPIHPEVFARLVAQLQGKQRDDHVFPRFASRSGGVWTRLFHGVLEAAGCDRFERRHRGYHLLRHTYATAMVKRGVDLVKGTGGWSSAAAARRYDHHKVSEQALQVAGVSLRPAAPTLSVVGGIDVE